MTTPDPRNDDFTEDVRAALGARMHHMDVGEGDLDGVVSRARRGQAAMRIAAAAAVVVVLAGGGALAMQLARGQVDPPDVVAPTLTQTPVPTPGSTGAGATPAPSTPAATATATPTPTATATPTPSALPTESPEPTTPTAEQVMRTLLTTPGNLVSATADGIDVIEPDGTTHDVPGLTGQVHLAWADGSGGVVFQRNEQGIGLLRDGQVSTLVALSHFGDRDVTIADGDDTVADRSTVSPYRLQLEDVDAATGRMAYWVRWRGDDPFRDEHQGDFTATVRGEDRREDDFDFGWESGSRRAIAGAAQLVEASGEGFGAVSWSRGDQSTVLYEWGPGLGPTAWSVELAPDEVSAALLVRDDRVDPTATTVEVVDGPSGDHLASWDVVAADGAAGTAGVVDVTERQVAVCTCESVWVHRAGSDSATTLHDRETGAIVMQVPGRATIVP